MKQGMFDLGELWIPVKDGDNTVRHVFDNHYSRRHYRDGRSPKLFVGPGEKMVLRTVNADAIFIWRKFISLDDQTGINCAVFRNEGKIRSSDLILAAEQKAIERWPDENRFYTYVNSRKIKSTNPGFCFIMAGWHKVGLTKSGLVILAKDI